MLRDYMGSSHDEKLAEINKANQANRAQELAALLKGAQSPEMLSQSAFTDPDIQKMAMQLRIKQATEKGDSLPAPIQQYEYGEKLRGGQDQKAYERFMAQIRNPYLNAGREFVNPYASNDALPPVVGKTLPPQDAPETRGAQQAAVERAKIEAIPSAAAAESQAKLANAGTMGQAARQEKLAETSTQRSSALQSKGDQLDLLDSVTDKAISQAGIFTTGFFGNLAKGIGGTEAKDLASNLDTIKSIVGFDKLAEMRANSPTGGALGNVSDRENALLQSVWGALEQSQSKEQFKENLERVRTQAKKSWSNIRKAYEIDYGTPYPEANQASGSSVQSPAQNSSSDIVKEALRVIHGK